VVSAPFERFSGLTVSGAILAFAVGAFVTPPDPVSQLAFTGVALPLVAVLAYLLSYRAGSE
jgi:Sec-independent protein secretion pathway component TatC